MKDTLTWTDGGLMRCAGRTVSLRESRTQSQHDGTHTYRVQAFTEGAWLDVGTWKGHKPAVAEVAIHLALALPKAGV